MADTKVSALSSFTPIVTDLLYGVDDPGGTPVSAKMTIGDIFALAAKSTLAAGTLTADTPHTFTATFNNAAVTFNGKSNDFTDTASNAATLLERWRVGGSTVFSINKAGGGKFSAVTTIGNTTNGIWLDTGLDGARQYVSSSIKWELSGYGLYLTSNNPIAWSNSASNAKTSDLFIQRDAADTLAQRRGANAQASRLYGTYTDGSNYRRLAFGMTTAGVASIAPEGAGTGATGNVLHISGLPASNPGPGILWNNAGTVEVGT